MYWRFAAVALFVVSGAWAVLDVKFGADDGRTSFSDMVEIPDIPGVVQVNTKFADAWKLAVLSDKPCASLSVDASFIKGIICASDVHFDDPNFVYYWIERPPWNIAASFTVKCFDSETTCAGSTSGTAVKNDLIYHNQFDEMCSSMPHIITEQPAHESIIREWNEATLPTWSVENDEISCNCGNWTFFLSTSSATITDGRSQALDCVEVGSLPPPASSAMSFNISTWNLTPNNASTPWYWWQAQMENRVQTLKQPTETRSFCIPEKPTLPALLSPIGSQKIPGTVASGFPVTFEWRDPSNWGFNCSTDPVSFNLQYTAPNMTTINWIQGNTYSTVIDGNAGDGTKVTWTVMARSGDFANPDSGVTCIELVPSIPALASPANNAIITSSSFGLSWSWIGEASPCGLTSQESYFKIELGLSAASMTTVLTAPSSSTKLTIFSSMLPNGTALGSTVYWRMSAVKQKGNFILASPPSSVFSFKVCIGSAPTSPVNLAADFPIVCLAGSAVDVSLRWDNPLSWGSHCEPPPLEKTFFLEMDGKAHNQTDRTHTWSLLCSEARHTFSVAAFNGESASTLVSTAIDFCVAEEPQSPELLEPESGSRHYAEAIKLSWKAVNFTALSCSHAPAKFVYQVHVGTGDSLPLFATVEAPTTLLEVSHESFAMNTELRWSVTAATVGIGFSFPSAASETATFTFLESVSVVIIITFDENVTDPNNLETEIADVLGIDPSLVSVVVISPSEIQVTIVGETATENANQLVEIIQNGATGSASNTEFLRKANGAFIRHEESSDADNIDAAPNELPSIVIVAATLSMAALLL